MALNHLKRPITEVMVKD